MNNYRLLNLSIYEKSFKMNFPIIENAINNDLTALIASLEILVELDIR